MTFTVKIDTDNAAFEGDHGPREVARILRKLAKDVEGGLDCALAVTLKDINGNDCGRAKWKGLWEAQVKLAQKKE